MANTCDFKSEIDSFIMCNNRYLRWNINMLKSSPPILFTNSLKKLQNIAYSLQNTAIMVMQINSHQFWIQSACMNSIYTKKNVQYKFQPMSLQMPHYFHSLMAYNLTCHIRLSLMTIRYGMIRYCTTIGRCKSWGIIRNYILIPSLSRCCKHEWKWKGYM